MLDATLQHREATGKSLLDASFEYGLVWQAEVEMTKRAMSAPDCYFPLSLLQHHVELDPEIDTASFSLQAFASIVELTAQLWTRLVLKFSNFPWVLIRLVDARTSEADKAIKKQT